MHHAIGYLSQAAIILAVRIINLLHAAAGWYKIFGNGNFNQAVIGQIKRLLYQALTVTPLTDDHGAIQILKGAGHNFGCGC